MANIKLLIIDEEAIHGLKYLFVGSNVPKGKNAKPIDEIHISPEMVIDV